VSFENHCRKVLYTDFTEGILLIVALFTCETGPVFITNAMAVVLAHHSFQGKQFKQTLLTCG